MRRRRLSVYANVAVRVPGAPTVAYVDASDFELSVSIVALEPHEVNETDVPFIAAMGRIVPAG